jgi:hypothetical protein
MKNNIINHVKKTILLPLAFIIMLVLQGCEKVIDVDLNVSEPVVVIEGNLSWKHTSLKVKISTTGSYFDSGGSEPVEGAAVFLETAAGVRMEVKDEGEDNYRLDRVPLKGGSPYKLIAEVDGYEYSAVSVLNPSVKIDSLSGEFYKEARFFDGGFRIQLFFMDPAGQKNYYRVKVYKNGALFNSADDLIVFDDGVLDGKSVQVRLRGQTFAAGDTARVELLSICKNAWEYFNTLREMASLNPGSPSPANPVTNFTNGALGYFSAWSHSSKVAFISAKSAVAVKDDEMVVLDFP